MMMMMVVTVATGGFHWQNVLPVTETIASEKMLRNGNCHIAWHLLCICRSHAITTVMPKLHTSDVTP